MPYLTMEVEPPMMYLFLAISCSALVSLVMRLSEKYTGGGLGKLAVNYIMCCALAFLSAPAPQSIFAPGPGLGLTLGLGAVNGVLYLAGFVLLQWNIARNGVVLPSTFMKLGVLVPTALSILVFRETPRAVQLLGMAAAIAAIFILQGKSDGRRENRSIPGLILLLLSGGTADAMSKVFEEANIPAFKDAFLLTTFLSALVLCILLCVIRRQRPDWKEVLFGLLLGVPNYFSSRFLLLSLAEVPAMVAYPSFSVGTIVLVSAAGVLFFREKLNRRKLCAIGLILVALILLNV